MTGAVRLGDWPGTWVELACRRCDRRGRYRRETLLARYGPDQGMPDLLSEISADCPHRQRQRERLAFGDRCGAYYANAPGLAELGAEAAGRPMHSKAR